MADTINGAIKEVLHSNNAPMSANEIYRAIVARGLYTFNADDPQHVVRNQLRRHALGIDFPSANRTKHYEARDDGTFALLERSISSKPEPAPSKRTRDGRPAPSLAELKRRHRDYEDAFRERLLKSISKLDPTAFELFAKKLLDVYGFENVKVTRPTKDGGIDGHGRLRVGLARLRVAFQCKRWNANAVGRPEIDRFRGAIQGAHEQGMFFTTGRFTTDAEQASFRPGAVPIILVDGRSIVDLMIEKRFGVEVDSLPIYSYALDLVIDDPVSNAENR
jgi:restriction system protein